MSRNLPAIVVAAVVLVVIACMMCAYQMRFTETVVVTRFDRILEKQPKEPGLHFKLPWPIERVHRFDTRLRTFETEFRQASTKDQKPIILTTFATWRVNDGVKFLQAFPTEDRAAPRLRGLLANQVEVALRRYNLNQLVNSESDQMKLARFEQEILDGVKPDAGESVESGTVGVRATAMKDFGIEVVSIGVKRLGLSESVTTNVFERMKAERENVAKQLEAEGYAEATRIRDEAKEISEKIRTRAMAYAKTIRGQGEAEAAAYYAVFEENRALSDFLKKLETVNEILRSGKLTLVIDAASIMPFELLNEKSNSASISRSVGDASNDGNAGKASVAARDREDDLVKE